MLAQKFSLSFELGQRACCIPSDTQEHIPRLAKHTPHNSLQRPLVFYMPIIAAIKLEALPCSKGGNGFGIAKL